jgi:hypothetical protein
MLSASSPVGAPNRGRDQRQGRKDQLEITSPDVDGLVNRAGSVSVLRPQDEHRQAGDMRLFVGFKIAPGVRVGTSVGGRKRGRSASRGTKQPTQPSKRQQAAKQARGVELAEYMWNRADDHQKVTLAREAQGDAELGPIFKEIGAFDWLAEHQHVAQQLDEAQRRERAAYGPGYDKAVAKVTKGLKR